MSLLASLALSFTLVPVLFKYLMRAGHQALQGAQPPLAAAATPAAAHPQALSANSLVLIHLGFERGFHAFREGYRNAVAWALSQPKVTVLAFLRSLMAVSLLLFPLLGRDFFPQVDAGQMRLHVRAPPGTRLETTQQYFARGRGGDPPDRRQRTRSTSMLDNIGLPYSGINIALSDSATVGPDGRRDPDLAQGKAHARPPSSSPMLRRELPRRFPELQFFFQPADIVDQVLNFGQPAPIDIRVSGPDSAETYALAAQARAAI